MRKRYRVLLIAAIVAAVAGKFGYALSIEPQRTVAMYAHRGAAQTTSAVIAAPAVLRAATSTAPQVVTPGAPLPDAGKLLLVGTFLFGLSALVRKAI